MWHANNRKRETTHGIVLPNQERSEHSEERKLTNTLELWK